MSHSDPRTDRKIRGPHKGAGLGEVWAGAKRKQWRPMTLNPNEN